MAPADSMAPRKGELIAIIIAAVFHVLTEVRVSPTAAYIYNVSVCLLFLVYLVWRAAVTPGLLRAWGMRTDNFPAAWGAQALFAVPAAGVVVAFGYFFGAWPLRGSFWMILALYPLWGVAQQFALQNLLARNLAPGLPRPVPHALVAALLFSAAHFPNWPLMVLTLGAGFFFTLIYRRHPNLWAVGLWHGLLGALAYYLVLGEDPGRALVQYLGRI